MFMARGDVGNVRAGFVKISKDIKHTCLLLNYLKATRHVCLWHVEMLGMFVRVL